MAISASTISSNQTLEEFRLEFNKLRSDVNTLESNPTYGTSIIFEGATTDAFETTLTVTDPTVDRTITLPNLSGTVTLDGNPASADGSALGSTSLEWSDLYIADGGIVYFGDDQDVTLTHVADTGVLLNSTRKIQFNDASQFIHGSSATALTLGATDKIDLTAAYVGLQNGATGPGELRFYEDTDLGSHYTGFKAGNATSSISYVLPLTDGSDGHALKTDGSGTLSWGVVAANTPSSADGQALGSTSLEWSDLFLADGSIVYFGDDQDVTLTHVADTGLLLNSTMALQFNDATQFINAPSATVLDINATDEVEVNATLMDVNANLDVSGTYTGGGLMTTGGNIVIPDDGNVGSVSDTNAISISSGGVVAVSAITASTSSTTGALTVAGGAGIAADLSVGDDIFMLSDGAQIAWGTDSDGNAVIGIDEADAITIESGGTDGAGTHAGYGIVQDTAANENDAVLYQHQDIRITSPEYHPLVRKGEGTFITLETGSAGGPHIIDETDGDNIIGEDEVFLHSGIQRNVINIIGSDGKIKNSVAGFAPGAI